MSIDAASHWVIRDDGNDANGALFADLDPGTSVDYSNQAAAQLSLSDIATDGAGTGVSSVTGGFTAAMVGNGIHLDDTAGWYQITAYTDTNNVTIDRSAGADKSGVTGNVGGAHLTVEDAFLELPEPGNTVYLRKAASAYVIPIEVYLSKDGTLALPITFEGFETSFGDDPTGTDQPEVDCGSTRFMFGRYWFSKNVRYKGSNNSYTLRSNTNFRIENCRISNTGSGTPVAFQTSTNTIIDDCEFLCTNGNGIDLSSGHINRCYIHDCGVQGVRLLGAFSTIRDSIIDSCAGDGLALSDLVLIEIEHCVLYNNNIGIDIGSADMVTIKNCQIVDNTTTGISAATLQETTRLDYNNFRDNGADTSNVTKGSHATALDPGFTDAPGGDFSGVDLADAFTLRLGVG